jgi:hypothetical protein
MNQNYHGLTPRIAQLNPRMQTFFWPAPVDLRKGSGNEPAKCRSGIRTLLKFSVDPFCPAGSPLFNPIPDGDDRWGFSRG